MNENVLTQHQIADMKKCGRILCESLQIVTSSIRPGMATKHLDEIAEYEIKKRQAVPSFLNYHVKGVGRYPSTLCVSINDEIVHGLPSKHRLVQSGDIISLDIGARFNGMYTDMAVTVGVGEISEEAKNLIEATNKALKIGIDQAIVGNTIGDIGSAIEESVLRDGFQVVKDYVGHGIGSKPHMWPQIPNYGKAGSGPKIIEGMALAIEPMTTIGDAATKVHDDNWTVMTQSGNLAAHFEHTVIIENGRPSIITIC